ncbi:MAG TPA: POTRA domain-containing protein, partial [Pyrinomonadaceae bacterium]
MAFVLAACSLSFAARVAAQTEFNDRPIKSIAIVFPTGSESQADEEEFHSIAEQAVGDRYSVVRVRDSIQALHRTNKIIAVDVEATDTPQGVDLRYDIKRKPLAQKVSVDIQNVNGEPVTEQELMFKLNLLDPGTPITDQTLQSNANVILEYLRDRGYFNAEVTFTQTPVQGGSG